jgi:hypothetical protein
MQTITAKKGVPLEEGQPVYWTNPDRYEMNGHYWVYKIFEARDGEPAIVSLTKGSEKRSSYGLAFPEELEVLEKRGKQ